MKIGINIEHAFHTLPRYFSSPVDGVREAIQNAYRSYCPNPTGVINISIDSAGDDLTIEDFGRGILNPEVLLGLMCSEWNSDVSGDQDPAGLGVCALIAYSDSVEWSSKFGSVCVDSSRFFNDVTYRDALQADPLKTRPVGTRVILRGIGKRLRTESKRRLVDVVRSLVTWYRGVRFTLDGAPLDVTTLEKPLAEIDRVCSIHTSSDFGSLVSSVRRSFTTPNVALLWHGSCIPVYSPPPLHFKSSYEGVELAVTAFRNTFIAVTGENLITPRLPDRNDLVYDQRTNAFIEQAFQAYARAHVARAIDVVLKAANPANTFTKSDEETCKRTFENVQGFEQLFNRFSKRRKVHLFESNNCGKRVKKIIHEDSIKGEICDDFVLVNGKEYSVTTDLGGIYLGEDDPLAEKGIYNIQGEIDRPRYILSINTGESAVWKHGHVLIADDAEISLVEVDDRLETKEGGQTIVISVDSSFLCFTDAHVGDNTFDDVVIIGDADEARRFYVDIYQEALSNGDISIDESSDTMMRDYTEGWERLLQSRDGRIPLSSLYDLRRLSKAGGSIVVNFKESTVTDDRGETHRVAFI